LSRCLKYIEKDEGIKYEPQTDESALPILEGIKTADEQIKEVHASLNVSLTKPVAQPVQPAA